MSFTLSANMQLPIPGVGSEAGPNYAFDVNNSLTLVDQHDHTAGKGVPITPAGMSINTALSFNNNFATSLAGLTLVAQSSTPVDATIYRSGDDLFYIDGIGNTIQITANGGIAGTPGSIANLTPPASVSYVSASSTFVFQSDVNIAANLDGGSLLLRNISPNSTNSITLSPPAALSSSYDLTLPTLPNAQKIMTLDASGNITAPYTVDGSTITVSSNVISVPAGGITSTQIATNTIQYSNISTAVHGLSLNRGTVTFNTAGSTTWVVPAGVTDVILEAVGGGGGGSGSNVSQPGNGGEGSSKVITFISGLTPGDSIPIVIGALGSGGFTNTEGVAGGATLFNGVTVAAGGRGGGETVVPYFRPPRAFFNQGGNGGITNNSAGANGAPSETGLAGGTGGPAAITNGIGGGGGGAGSFGAGGAGGAGSSVTGGAASGNGAGGGGAGANASAGGTGGNGTPGQLNIYW